MRIDGKLRSGLAAISLPSRALTPWHPTVSGPFTDLATARDAVYVTGPAFSAAGEIARRTLAALDPRTGRLLPWNPIMPGDGTSEVVDTVGDAVVIHGTERASNWSARCSSSGRDAVPPSGRI